MTAATAVAGRSADEFRRTDAGSEQRAGSSRSARPTTPPRRTRCSTRRVSGPAALLAAAKPVTEKVRKGEGTFYRARFAGLDSASAETACRSLKRSGFACFAARD